LARKNKNIVSKVGPSGADFTTDSINIPKNPVSHETMDEWSKNRGTKTTVTEKNK